ncbi:DUF6457 domain-containing protein [Serinibacter salmoneus]|uniref:DUF6457 domain-containing protein n=1 Tax=Serinibacter salmoneus TaxID=556530 RepID=A0A2A9D3V7_9MICO|nr:DUF6457 domain-containing protein [Serinibacter salmoneus]PFG21026.1 hypothetical protein ATL40_2645 [Serinibacter salmoneus]
MTTPPRPAHHLPPEDLTDWADAVARLFGLSERLDATDIGEVLDVARDVSRGVNRPSAPLSTFLLGVAVARSVPDGADRESVAAEISRLGLQVRATALSQEAE